VRSCPDPENGYNVEKSFVQIIEKRRYDYIHIFSCLIEVTRIITYCGAFSHQSAVEGGISTYIYELGGEECRKTHAYRQFRGVNGHIISKLKTNSTVSTTLLLAGKIDAKYNCEGAQYYEDGKQYNSVIVQADIKITLKDYFSKVALDNNEIHLQNGVKCPFLEGYCMDSINGESTWDKNYSEMCKQFNVVYEGVATFVEEKGSGSTNNFYVVVEDKEKVFAIQLISQEKVCGINAWQSEHPRLLAVRKKYSIDTTPFTDISKNQADADLITYVNTKFLYVEQSFKRAINEMFAQTIYRRCLLHREILKNRLVMATVNPNTVATLVKNKLGYVAKVVGEVMYIMKCVALPVDIRRTSQCYTELPVTAYNKSFFMSPITRILQEHAEQIECNSIIPPMYFLDKRWMGFDPSPNQGITPQELKVDSEETVTFHTIKDLGAGGLYTYSEIKKAQDELLFGLERNALSNILVRRIAGQEVQSQGFSTLNLFNKQEMEKLANSTIRALYGWLMIIGDWTSSLLGIYFIFRMIKFIVETFMNAVAIHRFNGCSFHLLASCWDTLTLFVLHHKQQEEMQRHEKENMANTFIKLDDPADNLTRASAPKADHEKRVTFMINDEIKPEANNLTNTAQTTNYSTLSKNLNSIPKIKWSLFDRIEAAKP
jgi:hypothetical protein